MARSKQARFKVRQRHKRAVWLLKRPLKLKTERAQGVSFPFFKLRGGRKKKLRPIVFSALDKV